MTYAHNSINIPYPGQKPGMASPALAVGVTPRNGVEKAIAKASARTGVDFGYLMNKANIESSMNPQAKAKTSSATGLYQFIEKTWLQMVRDHGEKYGLGKYASQIDGECKVSSNRVRQAILELRKDPETSACMAAEYAAQNAQELENKIGNISDIGETELYMAHFLGPTGAAKFIAAMHDNPDRKGASVFPQEARTNQGVFYDRASGKPRSLEQIYNFFERKLSGSGAMAASTPLMEEDMLSGIRNNRGAPSRMTSATSRQMATTLPASAEQFIGETRDSVAVLEPDMVDRLLAHPPQPFERDEHNDNNQRPKPLAEQLATLRRQDHQAKVLVLAQLMAHEDNSRYNS